MFQIWFDDSGKGHGPVFVLAGYLGRSEDWRPFADDWATLLSREPSKLDYIKGYEAFGLRRQFKGWTNSDRDARLKEFLQVIERYSGKGLAIVIPHDAFGAILKRSFQPFKNPYMFAYALSFSVMLHFAHGNPDHEPIELIFDNSLIEKRQAEKAYKEIFQVYPATVVALLASSDPRFEDDKQFNHLQAADLLAYCVRARYETSPRYVEVRESPIYRALAGGHARGPHPGDLYLIGDHTILIEITEAKMNAFERLAVARQRR